MTPPLDLRVTELLCSRLCHDLISPISAINNGMELIAEMGDEARDDAEGLIRESAHNANRRLRAFRYAFGLAGQEVGLEEIRNVAHGWFDGGKLQLDWAPITVALPASAGKVILNLLMLAPEVARGTGRVIVSASPGEIAVNFSATQITWPEDLAAALDGAILPDNLDPRSAMGLFIAAQVARLGARLVHTQPAPDALTLRLHFAGAN